MTKIEDSFEYKIEEEKKIFQSYINALMEVSGDFAHKISLAKGNNKAGVWLEISDAELVKEYLHEAVSNLMSSYTTITETNRLLQAQNQILREVTGRSLKKSVEDYRNDKITKDQFAERVNEFVGVGKLKIA